VTSLSNTVLEHLHKVVALPDLACTKYSMIRKIGEGGMGEVFLVKDTSLEREVALKILHSFEEREEIKDRLIQEARILARLEHPSIVPIHDVGMLQDGRLFYVMKYVEGARLDQYVSTTRQSISTQVGKHNYTPALILFQKIVQAIDFAHSHGILHRDLKPENIIVGKHGEVMVLDWGVAKQLHAAEPSLHTSLFRNVSAGTQYGKIIGTPQIMSPEQAAGNSGELDERTDVYSLGIILHYLLTGTLPSEEKRSKIYSKPLTAIVQKATKQEPVERYSSASELLQDTEKFMLGEAVMAYQERPYERLARWIKRYRFVISIIIAYLMMRLAVLFFLRS